MSRVLEAIARQAEDSPFDRALSCRERVFHYAALHREIRVVAEALEGLLEGVAMDRPVALAMDNDPAWVLLDLALVRLGRPSAPLPPFFTEAQRMHALADCGAALLITDREVAGGSTLLADGKLLRAIALGLPAVALPPGTAKITYTSGSTGAPKGVCLSQAGMEAVAASLVEVIGREFAHVHACVLPLAVLLENVAGVYAALLAGGAVDIEPLAALGFADPFRPDFARMARTLAEVRATSLILVPELLRGLVGALAGGAALPDLKLVAVGGAKVAPALLAAARAVGLPAVEGYGLSECASVVALNTPDRQRPGTVGRPLPHLRVSVAEDGEILVGSGAFLGYVGQPASPTEPWPTGDLGAFDADGFLSVTGRKADTLITAFGRNVAPAWIESELLARPEIGQALVFGEGLPALAALIVPTSPEQDVAHAVAEVNASLPAYARVASVHLTHPFTVENGMLTGNGRPRRAAILAAHAHLVTPDSLRITA